MLPKAAIERVVRKAGIDRISADALEELQRTIEELGLELARDASQAAKYAKRKTIKKEDIIFAAHK